MQRKAINPESMYQSTPLGFSHAVECTGTRMLHLAGQVALDSNGGLVGADDLALQTKQVFDNLAEVLKACGAGPENVVRLRTYIVDHTQEKLGVIIPYIFTFYGDVEPAANTVVGVQSLATKDFLIEVEVTAILDSLA